MDKYAVIGNPVAHSLSPQIHQQFAEQTSEHIQYEKILAPIDGFNATANAFIAAGGHGFNITVPFKQEAFELAEQLSSRAEFAGAVNTIKRQDDGTLFGDNTDGAGLVRDIEVNQKYALQGKHILLLGAGGAARGALKPLLDAQTKSITIANRTLSKAEHLKALFQAYGEINACGFTELKTAEFDLIINATSAGLNQQPLNLPSNLLAENGWCYDMVYGDNALQWTSNQRTNKKIDGLGMLIEQAAEAFYLWRGVRPDTRSVSRRLNEII